MAGLAKGLAILETFGAGRASLTISQAAEATGVTRATARRCLLQLAELGYLVMDHKHFRPTPRLMRLGSAYLATATLPQLAQPILEAARDRLAESVSLTVLDDGFVLFLARAQAQRVVSMGFQVGVRAPAWNTAAGRILLGSLSDAEREDHLSRADIRPRTPHTVTDRAALARIVREAVRAGFALVNEELELGMRSLAVPVLGREATIIAAISASTLSARSSAAEMRRSLLPVLREAATAIERKL